MVVCSKNRRIQCIPFQLLFLIVGIVLWDQPLHASPEPTNNNAASVVADGIQEALTAPIASFDYDYSHDTEDEYDCIRQNSAVVPALYSAATTLASESTSFSGHTLPASLARLYDHEYDDGSFCAFTECFLAPRSGTQITDLRSVSAGEANAPFVAKGWSGPYAEGTRVRSFTTASDLQFARVHTAANPQGAFLVRAEEIAGMTPQQIQQHLALPKVPTHVSTVTVPSGTTMQMGRVAAQPAFGVQQVGGVQYQLLQEIPAASFGTPVPLQ